MAVRFWRGYYITCSQCGHRNRPHKSPREGIRLALLGLVGACKGCDETLHPALPDRPLVREVRAELLAQGIEPASYASN